MNQKQRIFIYDRKEMGVLVLLGVMVAVFAFTLGVHLGKRVGSRGSVVSTPETAIVATVPDQIPENKEMAEQAKSAAQAADETVNQALHDEVERTGLKLDTPKAIELPRKPKTANAGATTLKLKPEKVAATPARTEPAFRFTLQIGSYPAITDAKSRAEEIKNLGLKPFVREAEVKGKPWYRVYVGEYPTKNEAEKAGVHYRSKRMIDTFVVAKLGGEMSH